MEYPFGHPSHHHHHHHERRSEEEEEYSHPERAEFHRPPEYQRPHPEAPEFHRPQPPPDYGRPYTEPPVFHHPQPTPDYGRPYTGPPASENYAYQRPTPPPPSAYGAAPHFPQESPNYPPPSHASVQHVSHEFGPGSEQHHHHHNPISSIFHHRHEEVRPDIARKPTVRVFCKAEENHSLSIRDGKVILARSNFSDEFQHWIKDEKYSTRVKDEESFPSFSLVNKVTGQALKHSVGATYPTQLCPYNPDVLDESVLWTESKDAGSGFRAIRMVNNIRLNLDAFHGDKDHGGVHDGTTTVLWEWTKGDNQKWKIVPYYSEGGQFL